jgi:hypothetical protein
MVWPVAGISDGASSFSLSRQHLCERGLGSFGNLPLADVILSCLSSAITGMVNVEEAEWVKGLTEAAGAAFAQQLAEGQVKGPRLLLRFFAALTRTSVLLPADVLSLMEQMLEVAQSHAAAGEGAACTACSTTVAAQGRQHSTSFWVVPWQQAGL